MALKIMSIDDSKAVINYIKWAFSTTDIEVVGVLEGQEAIDMLTKSDAEQFAAIFLDWEMPAPNGPKVLKTLKESGIETPIIMLTSRNDEDSIMTIMEAGADDYIMKPFTPELLFEKLSEILDIEIVRQA